jgi:lipopolysaccharide transport system permease protein
MFNVMNTSGLTRHFAHFNPVVLFCTLWRHRYLMRQITSRELTQRYQGSYLGMLWSIIVPLLMMAVYTFVFSVVFKARWRSDTTAESSVGEFALTLFAGLTAFNVFAEVVNRAPTLILSVPNYVKKVVFPLEILPVVSTASAVINSLISIGLVIIGSLLLLHKFSVTILLLPLAYLPLIFLTLGLAWFLAALGVYIRDVAQIIGIVVQILFFVSPVFYPVSAVPAAIRPILQLNPLTTILESFRQVLLWGQPLCWGNWMVWTVGTFVFAMLGYAWFASTKKGFADVM